MSIDNKTKTRPVFAVASTGTALGTATSIIDTSAWKSMQVMSIHGGTGGSRIVSVYANAGTQTGTSVTAFPNPILVGAGTSDFAGLGSVYFVCGSLTDQAIITFGTSTNLSFSASYILFD